ncbi:MAG: hypothetical protein AAB788_00255 [Patescibacteria group bacterium]
MSEIPLIGIVQWAEPASSRIIKNIPYVGGLLRLTPLGEKSRSNLAKSANKTADEINCFAILNNSYNINLANENADDAEIIEIAKKYGVWLCNFAQTTNFTSFQNQLSALYPNQQS